MMKVINKTPALRIDSNLITVWRESLAGGNVGEFGESPVIHQTKTIQISTYN